MVLRILDKNLMDVWTLDIGWYLGSTNLWVKSSFHIPFTTEQYCCFLLLMILPAGSYYYAVNHL